MRRADLLVKKFINKDKSLNDITDEVLLEQSTPLAESIKVTVGDITLAKEPGALKLAELLLRKKSIRDLLESLQAEILAVVSDDVKAAAVITSMAFKNVSQNEGIYDLEEDHRITNLIAQWRAKDEMRQKIDKQIEKDQQKSESGSKEIKESHIDKQEEKPKKKRTYKRRKKKDEPEKTVEAKKVDEPKVDDKKESVEDKTNVNTFVEPLPKVEKTVRIPATDSLLVKLREAENDPDSGFLFQEDIDWCVDRDEIVFSEKMHRHAAVKKMIEGDTGDNDQVIVTGTTSLED